ncbi:unnamed protein product [Moneuplotes crassus]|uniref:Uncharacterized protein n=1 Tax=Euplotes crassus TaxID=5936 RepID=A0AAD2D8X5_EUPCR|nr:unnamed protein product [Moneuplotes crassus]
MSLNLNLSEADTTRNSITENTPANEDIFRTRRSSYNGSSVTRATKNLQKFIHEHNRWKDKVDELNTKKTIFKIIKRRLSVQSTSFENSQNFTVNKQTLRLPKRSGLLNRLKLNTSVKFRNKDQKKFDKLKYCKDLTNLFLKHSVKDKFHRAAIKIQKAWRGRKSRIFIQCIARVQHKAATTIQDCWRKYWSYKMQVKKWEGTDEPKNNMLIFSHTVTKMPKRTFSHIHIFSHFSKLIFKMKEKKEASLVMVQKYMRGLAEYKKHEKYRAQGKLSNFKLMIIRKHFQEFELAQINMKFGRIKNLEWTDLTKSLMKRICCGDTSGTRLPCKRRKVVLRLISSYISACIQRTVSI